MKTIFLCRYLHSLELRREINEGLNVVENWNSANNFILYGKGGEFATNRREDQEITMLSLHLLQLCLVYINTLMIQQVLHKPQWQARMDSEDLRALTPLIYSHVTPYGTFRLDMNERLVIETAVADAAEPASLRRAASEFVYLPHGREQRLLHEILGDFLLPRADQRVAIQAIAVIIDPPIRIGMQRKFGRCGW